MRNLSRAYSLSATVNYSMKILVWIGICFLLSGKIAAQEIANLNDSSQKKQEIKVGVWIDQIGQIDYQNNTYEIIFYLWVNSKDSAYNLENNIDFTNTWESEILYHQRDSLYINGEKEFHEIIKVKTKNTTQFNLSNFPFDTNILSLAIELIGHYTGDLTINIDQNNSRLNSDINKDWIIKMSPIQNKRNRWDSDFGNLKGSTEVDAISLDLELSRNAWPIYFKLFAILFLAFILATLSFFLPNQKSEEKVSIVVGALFTAIGNKYITESVIPISNHLGLSDLIHFSTILYILVIIIFGIVEQRKKIKDSILLDFSIFTTFIVLYAVTVILITRNYMGY
jgi:hypothetical protein